MAESQDTEITLGAGNILVLFFGLVALCSVFFGLGFKVGRGSTTSPIGSDQPVPTNVVSGGVRPSATKTSVPAAIDKAASQDTTPPQTAKVSDSNASSGGNTPADPMLPPPTSGYFVQVAAVSKQEDAEALVDALRKKQYSAVANSMADKLFHVQVGPFADIKDAELTRAKLVSDGYNPILKK